jgi:hypothetical protein
MSIGSVTSARMVSTNLSAEAFARGAPWRDLADSDVSLGQHGVEGGGELPGPVPDQHP